MNRESHGAEPRWLPFKELYLDPENPRLAGQNFALSDQDQILKWLWQHKSVNELVGSMVSNGYWTHEELFAAEENDKLVVLEGNRRLAAVKLLMEASLAGRLQIQGVPTDIGPEVRKSLEKLPVIVKPRSEIWDYIGFKHVNGPQAWDSIAKAEYVYRVKQDFGIGTAKIAATIGDKHDTVARLYRGYLVLKQAQDNGLFDPKDSWKSKFPFSHLWVALGYTKVRKFLGLAVARMEKPNPVPPKHQRQLQEFMLWLFGSKKDEIEPKVRRQNPHLRNLVEVLDSPRGLKMLRAGLPLPAAVDASLGDERLFQDALTRSENELRDAKGYVATGYDGDEDLLLTAKNLVDLARSLHREMREHQRSDEDG